MTRVETTAIRQYLQHTFGVRQIEVSQSDGDKPALVKIHGKFVGTVHRDEDDGEVSYALTVTILADDLV